ncbi:MAG: hypothetical protein D6687_03180 [Acidobacteria bacterium]|jgi:hypothetical protein|nr:MAG: hypothetical protein D6687_03180 [Acidobacteriota bacterium]GIU83211.1 MAG: hypothetical protein KatS3mg006_2275 [Pyrinomonadaceae bacterium]
MVQRFKTEQLDLWDSSSVSREKYFVFHDESIPNKRWLLIGLVFVNASNVQEVRNILRQCRAKENYYGEVHFSDLPRMFGGKFGAKANLARE